jgi:ABC-type polysaccharide/polyol phosphate transport system ATPase subunit
MLEPSMMVLPSASVIPAKNLPLANCKKKYLTHRDAIVNLVKAPFKRFHHATPAEEFWALKDVSFDVEQR